jgi:hypothetical protein
LALPPRPYGVSTAGPRGLRITAVPASYSLAVHPPRSFSPPTESYETSPPPVFRLSGSFLEVPCLIAPSVPRVRSPRWFPRHRRLPSSGFRNPSTACSPRYFAGLFHPTSTSRLSPSGCFPRKEPPQLIAVTLPSCGYRETTSPFGATASKPHFRALLPLRVRCVRSAVKRTDRPIPSWAFPSPGLASLQPLGRASTSFPSRACLVHVRDVNESAPQGLLGPE